MSLFEVGGKANFGKFATRHFRIKIGVPGTSCLGLAARFADRLIVLADGRVAADGPPRGPAAGHHVTQPVAWSRRP